MSIETDKIVVPRGGYGYGIAFTCKDAAGAARNMSAYTGVTFEVWRAGNPTVTEVSAAGSWTVEASGTCSYTVVDGDFDTPGNFKFRLIATATGVEDPCRTGDLEVEE